MLCVSVRRRAIRRACWLVCAFHLSRINTRCVCPRETRFIASAVASDGFHIAAMAHSCAVTPIWDCAEISWHVFVLLQSIFGLFRRYCDGGIPLPQVSGEAFSKSRSSNTETCHEILRKVEKPVTAMRKGGYCNRNTPKPQWGAGAIRYARCRTRGKRRLARPGCEGCGQKARACCAKGRGRWNRRR